MRVVARTNGFVRPLRRAVCLLPLRDIHPRPPGRRRAVGRRRPAAGLADAPRPARARPQARLRPGLCVGVSAAALRLAADALAEGDLARARRLAALVRLPPLPRLNENLASLHRDLVLCRSDWSEHPRVALADWIKYRPGQPRVPAGSPDGGQWTAVGGSGLGGATRTPLRDGGLFHLVGTGNYYSACKITDYLASKLGMRREALRKAIHQIKDHAGLGGPDNVVIRISTGDVYFRGEYLGNVHGE